MASGRYRVVIVGGGVAAVETVLALHELADDRLDMTLLCPEPYFCYRPDSMLVPFTRVPVRRCSVPRIAEATGARWSCDVLERLDPVRRHVYTAQGTELGYDAVVLAYGAHAHDAFANARTIERHRLDQLVHALVTEVEGRSLERLALVARPPVWWPVPLYELALTAARAAHLEVSVTVVTPEPAPLAMFGEAASRAAQGLLERNGILIITDTECSVPHPGRVSLVPGGRELHVDSVVALGRLEPRGFEGVPQGAPHGFVPVDDFCRVRDLEDVFAAGDAADFPVKNGDIAAQQAETVARQIAARTGAHVMARPLRAVLRGMLLSGDTPLYVTAHLVDGQPIGSQASPTPPWRPATRITAAQLGCDPVGAGVGASAGQR